MMKYRNFKVIYGNVTFKKNVRLFYAYDYNAAEKIATAPLIAMGYEHHATVARTGVRTLYFSPKDTKWDNRRDPMTEIKVELVNLHRSRRKK